MRRCTASEVNHASEKKRRRTYVKLKTKGEKGEYTYKANHIVVHVSRIAQGGRTGRHNSGDLGEMKVGGGGNRLVGSPARISSANGKDDWRVRESSTYDRVGLLKTGVLDMEAVDSDAVQGGIIEDNLMAMWRSGKEKAGEGGEETRGSDAIM